MDDELPELEIEQRCPKCDGEMQQGFLLDSADGGARLVSRWVEGPPQKSFWLGTKVNLEDAIPIGTFRCKSCGFLESYAQRRFAPQ